MLDLGNPLKEITQLSHEVFIFPGAEFAKNEIPTISSEFGAKISNDFKLNDERL